MKVADKMLRPDYIHNSVCEINFRMHSREGYSYVIIDADRTIVDPHSNRIAQDIKDTLLHNRSSGNICGICVVSNIGISWFNGEERIGTIAEQINAECVVAYWWPKLLSSRPEYPRLKPSHEPFISAMMKMGSTPYNTLVIGDQLFTDILGGKLLGLRTIWIKEPLGKDHPITWLKRAMERQIAKKLRI